MGRSLLPTLGHAGTDTCSWKWEQRLHRPCIPSQGQEAVLGSPAMSGRLPNRTVIDLVAVAESGLVSSVLNQPDLGMG